MFKPQYQITEYFLKLAEQIAATSAKIEAADITFPLMVRLQKEALDRSAHSSTSIEGNMLSLAQVSALSEKRAVSADFKQKQEVLNYIEALQWIIRRKDTPLSQKHLCTMHSIILKSLRTDKKTGSYKVTQNYVVNEKGRVVHTPPPPKKCPQLVDELLHWIQHGRGGHPLIQSAIFHHQFVTIHPFSDGNGRLARIGAQWILYRKKFDPHHIISLDDFYAENRTRYYEKIQQTRELDYDFTHWIEYVGEGILETIQKAHSRIHALSYCRKTKIIITPRQEEVIDALRLHGALGSRDLGKMLRINRARVHQLMSPLVKAKIIKKEGSARATRYSIKR
ncbi:MAG: Fic family protein [Candidatus Omnitrophica bacterium]|nr:Fic family protein [Candidatus Omnitrophota bacterium]